MNAAHNHARSNAGRKWRRSSRPAAFNHIATAVLCRCVAATLVAWHRRKRPNGSPLPRLVAAPIDETKLREVLDQLPRGVLRLKGFVRLDSNPQRLRLVQGVGARWTICDANSNVEQDGCALVLIGAKELLAGESFSRIKAVLNIVKVRPTRN